MVSPTAATGFLLPLAADVQVVEGHFEWSWPLGAATLGPYSEAPVDFPSGEGGSSAPLSEDCGVLVRFANFWRIDLPPGWSLLVLHPITHEDLPFRTLSGLVDAETAANGLLHLPALWVDPEFEGKLPRGTPIAQCIPVQQTALDLVVDRGVSVVKVAAKNDISTGPGTGDGAGDRALKRRPLESGVSEDG